MDLNKIVIIMGLVPFLLLLADIDELSCIEVLENNEILVQIFT